jgi:hypothetical protein
MYNLSLFSSNINEKNTILSMYGLLCDAKLIKHPTVFCDQINMPMKIPVLNTYHLFAANSLVFADNTSYDMAGTFVSNHFITIDIPSRHQYSNVDHYSIEPFVEHQNNPEKIIEMLKDILNQEKYQYAKV